MRVYTFKNSPSKNRSTAKINLFSRLRKLFVFGRFKLKKRNFFSLVLKASAFGVVLIALLFLYYSKDLPDPNKLINRQVAESTKIFARDGELLYEIHGEAKRTLIDLNAVPEFAQNATIAIEDKDFYKHHGISFSGIARSMFRYLVNFGPSGGGGSTLTQQFVKNAILTNEKKFDRKIREAILSLAIEAKFEKKDILKLYLNEIPYGRNAYGIEAASKAYFNKSAKDINLAEAAYLAALPQAPTFYNPLGPNREALDKRKNTVLANMREQGYINDQQEKEARESEVVFIAAKNAILAPHFVLTVQDYLAKKYGEKTLQEGGLKVYTTLDLKLQNIAEEAVKKGAENNEKKYSAYNAALVAIDPKTGQVLAMVGSKDYFGKSQPEGCAPGKNCFFEPNVNVALSQRQPGSSFKPYVYVTAFKEDYNFAPATMLMDVVTNFGTFGGKSYIPQNYDGQEHGPVSMRSALAGSLNIPAVKTLALVGVDNAVETARSLGITSPMADCGLSLVLGGCEVRLIDHTAAFSALANGGEKNEKVYILKIEDRNGEILEEFKSNPKQVINPEAVYLLTDIMSDNAARTYVFGPNSPLTLPDRPVAAKTGTTQNWRDGWTMGFTPQLAVGVWAGNNCGDCLMKKGADGVLVAAPIWNQFMKNALKDMPVENFTRPEGIVNVDVDSVSGKLPTGNSPSTKNEVFAKYNAPKDYDDLHLQSAYDLQTGLLASADTPKERIGYRTYTVFKSERPDNPDWENPVKEWAQKNGYTVPENIGQMENSGGSQENSIGLNFQQPQNGTIISETPFKIQATASSNNIVKIEYFIDGQSIGYSAAFPFTLTVNKTFSPGEHIIAAKATDTAGKIGFSGIKISFNQSNRLILTEPASDSLVIFPVSLKASSSQKLEGVVFYHMSANGAETAIGSGQAEQSLSGGYEYSLGWIEPLKSGAYEIFARSESGLVSNKVKINIP